MAGAYKWKFLYDCDINDSFFNSLKNDYPDFEKWYLRKASEKKQAFTYYDDKGLGAFLMIKLSEVEALELKETTLPAKQRFKISTLKLSKRIEGNRLGEGAIGIALWNWLESDDEEIYVTVYEKHNTLIDMLTKFGFVLAGHNFNGECVYIRSKNNINFSTPYTSFPFISKNCNSFAILPIYDEWHDKLFPYSELKNTKQVTEEIAAANGMTKTYICFPSCTPIYKPNQPILIYRIYNGKNKTYKSVVTSYGVVTKFVPIKTNYREQYSLSDFLNLVGNKSVFSEQELKNFYKKRNMFVLELVYSHAFGPGKNVNHMVLKENNIWKDVYPFQAEYSFKDFYNILIMAKQDLEKLIK